MKKVEVAVGVIRRNNQIFITKRPQNLHQGGKWEFPGGKREADESMDQALVRELREEVGIETHGQLPLLVIEHDYGDKQVVLDVRIVEQFSGEPHGQKGQLGEWVAISALSDYEFPEANGPIIAALQSSVIVKEQ